MARFLRGMGLACGGAMSLGAPSKPRAHARPLATFLRALAPLVAGLLSCGEPGASGRSDVSVDDDGRVSTRLTPQLVNATVKRTTLRLIHIETAHERFVTTPEHPFATRDAGWVRAGDLKAGDLLISGRHGPIAVSSVRSEVLAQPVWVFNLTVDRTHAYLVGSDQVLVHNVRCNGPLHQFDDRRLEEELRSLIEELERRRAEGPPSRRRIPMIRARIDQLETELNRRNQLAGDAAARAADEARRARDDEARRARDEVRRARDRLARHERQRRGAADDEARARYDEARARYDEARAPDDEARARYDEARARYDEARAREAEARRAREAQAQQDHIRRTEVILRVVELRLALASNLREQQALRAGQSAPGRGQKRKRETPADPGPSSGAPGVAQQLAELQRQREANR
jgi:hypothetical protein